MKLSKKKDTASQLGGQTLFFFIGNLFTLAVGLPLQIYIAKNLGADGLGVFSLIEGGVVMIASLLAFGLAPTLIKFIPQHLAHKEYACIRQLLRNGLLILLVIGSLSYLLILYLLPIIVKQWPMLTEYRHAIIIMSALIPISIVLFFLQQGLRGFQEIRYMVIGSSFLQLTIKVIVTLLLLTAGLELIGYIWAVVISTSFAAAWMAIGLWKKFNAMPKDTTAIHTDTTTSWYNYAKIMYANTLLGVATQHLDRFLLAIFAGATPVGILVVVKQLQQMPVIFLQMFLAVAAPMLSAAHAKNDIQERQHIYHLTTDWVVRLSAPLFIFFLIFALPLLNLYGDDFSHHGKYALWILLAGQIFNLGSGPIGNVLNMSGMEKSMLKLSVYQTIIQAAGIIIMVPKYGLIGAALAITIGSFFINASAMWMARKKLNLYWGSRRYQRWILPLLLSLSTAIILHLFGPQTPNVFLMICYLITLYIIFHMTSLLQGLHEDDKILFNHLRNKFNHAPNH